MINQAGPFTVFAPTNDAFSALSAGVLDGLLGNPTSLANVILGHVLQGNFFSISLVSTNATFVNGNTAAIIVSAGKSLIFNCLYCAQFLFHTIIGECTSNIFYLAGITINGVKVTQADILASNGVVHVIDAVIVVRTSSARLINK